MTVLAVVLHRFVCGWCRCVVVGAGVIHGHRIRPRCTGLDIHNMVLRTVLRITYYPLPSRLALQPIVYASFVQISINGTSYLVSQPMMCGVYISTRYSMIE